ncbi:unnamed protein product [Paramecium primaurelia]|uniref:Cilia-and flagella-associated protein 96 n=1 Tax=Paramecium primaurelia TaxID=5886 RepID=A0A8S1K9H2_PARPR|nr:unnamed protein product [Paramecium primaurelia]
MSTQYRVPSNDNYIRDLENISQRERHGLFNQPPPLLLGDQYNDALKSQGKEKGILINKKLQKKHEPALFSEPGYTTLNDPYKDSFKAKQIYDKEKELAIKNPNIVESLRDYVYDQSMYLQELYDQQNSKTEDNYIYIPPMPKFATNTPVTLESFTIWKKKFDQEIYEIKKREKNFTQLEEMMKKISGKQYFDRKQNKEDDNEVLEIINEDDDIVELEDEDYQGEEDDNDEEDQDRPLYEREQLE